MTLALELVKQLIAIPSVTPRDEGCQAILKQRLTALGFTITDIPCEEASNFWAIKGDHGPTVVFAGHTDVVPAGPLEQWQSDPYSATEIDGFLYGRGSADMKGSLAAMIVACEQFYKRFANNTGRIAFLITSAEEGPSQLGTPKVLEYLQEKRQSIDYCIVGEPTATALVGDMIKNGRRGSLTGELTVVGKQGHIAYPHLAINPIHQALKALDDFIQIRWDEGNDYFPATSLQISSIQAGVAGNVIPGELQVTFNFRYSTEVTVEELEQRTKVCFDHYHLNYFLKWIHYGTPYLTQEGTLTTAAQMAITEICGFQPQISTTGGSSDGRYIAQVCQEVVELGLCNATIHHPNECIKIADLNTLASIYEKMLIHLLIPATINTLK